MDPNVGCPDVVIERPEETRHVLPEKTGVKTLEEQLDDHTAVGSRQDEPPWLLIILCSVGVILICCGSLILYRSTRPEPEPFFHSKSAKVLSDDTFIEPEIDKKTAQELAKHGIQDVGSFGVVKPRPNALREMLEMGKRRVPRAVQFGYSHQADEPIPKLDPDTGELYYTEDQLALMEDDVESVSAKSGITVRSKHAPEVRAVSPASKQRITFFARDHEKEERQLPGLLPGQITTDEAARPKMLMDADADQTPVCTAQGMALALPVEDSGPSNQAQLFPLKPLPVGEFARKEIKNGVGVGAPPPSTNKPAAATRYMRNMEGVRQTNAQLINSVCT
jgi:hypothetical protein